MQVRAFERYINGLVPDQDRCSVSPDLGPN